MLSRDFELLFYKVVWQHRSGEEGSEYTTYNFRHFANYTSKIIKMGGHLPKF